MPREELSRVFLKVPKAMLDDVYILAQPGGLAMSVIWRLAMQDYLEKNKKTLAALKAPRPPSSVTTTPVVDPVANVKRSEGLDWLVNKWPTTPDKFRYARREIYDAALKALAERGPEQP